MLIDVIWSGTHEEDEEFTTPFALRVTCLLPSWADCEGNASSAVQDVIEDWMDSVLWGDLVGDDNSMTVRVEIHSPPSIAGLYEVELDRVIKARAKKLEAA